jgi:hypothetical protein
MGSVATERFADTETRSMSEPRRASRMNSAESIELSNLKFLKALGALNN